MNSESELTTNSPEDVWHFRSALRIFDVKVLVFKLRGGLKWWKCLCWKVVSHFLSLSKQLTLQTLSLPRFTGFYMFSLNKHVWMLCWNADCTCMFRRWGDACFSKFIQTLIGIHFIIILLRYSLKRVFPITYLHIVVWELWRCYWKFSAGRCFFYMLNNWIVTVLTGRVKKDVYIYLFRSVDPELATGVLQSILMIQFCESGRSVLGSTKWLMQELTINWEGDGINVSLYKSVLSPYV